MSLSCCFWEAHFSCLSKQSNVYGLTSFRLPNGGSKVLVAPLKDNVLCLEYVKERGNLKPVAREVQFIYCNPDDAELVSISAFTKQPESTGLVVGITFTKDDGSDKPSHYFNIYYPWEKNADFNLDTNSQAWNNIEHLLDFIPYYLCHTDIIQDGQRDTVFLLTGGDCKVHLFKEDKESSSRFSEHPTKDLFPEFEDLPSIALWLSCQLLPNNRRLTAVGCQNGYIRLSLISSRGDYRDVVATWELQHDSAITCVKLFQNHTPVSTPSALPPEAEKEREEREEEEAESASGPGSREWHLLVTSALEVAVVYRDVVHSGLQRQLVLPNSDAFDCTLCACVADVDWDAQNEILLGTYGQELLCYKFFSGEDLKRTEADGRWGPEAAEAEGADTGVETEATTAATAANEEEGNGEGEAAAVAMDGSSSCRGVWEPDAMEGLASGSPYAEGAANVAAVTASPGEYRLAWSRSFAHPILAMKYVDLMSDGLYELILLSLKGVHILQHDLEEATRICEERLGAVHPHSSHPDSR